ncbi:MAG: [FeFe] hydrogenase H-cluster maturation GTPase HydF, partial [Oscillospiraceae bacterium]
ACTHAPDTEDIGRVKIPAMLRKKYGEGITVDVVSGTDFPNDLTGYDLVVHCGGCMFNKKYVMSRIQQCNNQNVNITNYGVLIAKLTGILDKISF